MDRTDHQILKLQSISHQPPCQSQHIAVMKGSPLHSHHTSTIHSGPQKASHQGFKGAEHEGITNSKASGEVVDKG